MKKSLLLLSLFTFAVVTSYAQPLRSMPTGTASFASKPQTGVVTSAPTTKEDTSTTSTQVTAKSSATPASQPAVTTTSKSVAAKPAATTVKSTTKSTGKTATARKRTTASKTATPVAAVKPVVKPAPAPSPFTMLSFVVNRGRVFAADAPGELTSIRLSGYYRTEADSTRTYIPKAAINEFSSANSLTLSGRAYINSDNSGKTTASAILCPLSAPQGLTLTLTVDGEALSVILPFVSSDRKWRSGYKYIYTVTVTGGALVVEGVTPLKLVAGVDK